MKSKIKNDLIKERRENLKVKTINGFLWLFGGSGSQALLQIAVLSILARLVTPYEFGIIGAALIVVGFSRIFSQIGMGSAIVQRSQLEAVHIRTAYTTSLLLGGFFAFIIFHTASYISSFFKMLELEQVLKAVAFIFIIESFSVISQSLLQRNLKFSLIAISNFISYLFGYGLIGVVLSFLEFGVWSLVYAHLGRAMIQVLLVSYFEPHSIMPYWNKSAFNELVYFSGGFTVGKIANYIALQGDNLIVGKWLGATSLGFYSQAYQIMVAPVSLVGSALNNALFPAMSSVQEDKYKLRNVFLRSIEIIALISLPLSIIIIINAPEIVYILLGEDWSKVVIPLQILGAGMVFRISYKISDSLSLALGIVYKRAWRQIVYAMAIFSGGILGQFWGINMVAAGVTFAIAANFLLMADLCLNELDIKWTLFLKKHIKPLIVSILFAVVAISILNFLRVYVHNIILRELIFVTSMLLFSILFTYKFRVWLGIEKEINLYKKIFLDYP